MADYDISVKQGATYQILLTIKDPDEVPLNLTGYTFRGQIRTSYSDPTIQASFEFELAPQTGGTVGQVYCTLTAAETTGIEVPETSSPARKICRMIYDIESETVDGEVNRWLEGAALVSPEVTR